MRRRDFLKSCAVTAGVLQVSGCGSENQQPVVKKSRYPVEMMNGKPLPQQWIDVTFKGLCLFVLQANAPSAKTPGASPDARTAPVDVILTRPERVGRPKHLGTLTIPRWAISADAPASAADENNAYFNLEGKEVKITPAGGGNTQLYYNYRSRSNDDPCGSRWDNMGFLIDLQQDVWSNAHLAADWRSKSFFSTIHLTDGELEYGQSDDDPAHFKYVLPAHSSSKLVAKENVRYRLRAPKVDFHIGADVVTVDTTVKHPDGSTTSVPIEISHVPSYWMTGSGHLADYRAFGELFGYDAQTSGALAVPSDREVCAASGPSTGGCECCPPPGIQV